MTDDQIINQITDSFTNYNLRDIQEINNNKLDFTIAEFILCSCLIDQISGFRYNTKKVRERYIKFVKEYLSNYNAEELYFDLRNKLVHNYSVGNYYALIRKSPHLHLQKVNGVVTCLNLENFILDLKITLEKYIFQLDNDQHIRQNALRWYSRHKILTLVSNY